MSESMQAEILRLIQEAPKAQLQAVVCALLDAAMPMAESERAVLTWLRKSLGGKP